MVKTDTRYENMRVSSYIGLVFGSMFIVVWVLLSSSAYTSVFPTAGTLGLFWMAQGLFFFVWSRRFKSLNARRQAAASGNDLVVPLAAVQPLANEAALPLPYVIKMRPRWWRSIAAAGLFTLPLTLILGTYTLVIGLWAWTSLGATLFLLGFTLLLFMPISIFLVWAGHYQIIATEEELAVRQTGSTLRIRWDEAALFAIMPRRTRTAPPNLYELSGADSIIPVHRVLRNALFPLSMKPTIPFDDYDRQMDALLSLIAAKTGLPLYDLR